MTEWSQISFMIFQLQVLELLQLPMMASLEEGMATHSSILA